MSYCISVYPIHGKVAQELRVNRKLTIKKEGQQNDISSVFEEIWVTDIDIVNGEDGRGFNHSPYKYLHKWKNVIIQSIKRQKEKEHWTETKEENGAALYYIKTYAVTMTGHAIRNKNQGQCTKFREGRPDNEVSMSTENKSEMTKRKTENSEAHKIRRYTCSGCMLAANYSVTYDFQPVSS